jgi:hypothetical protein
VGPQVSFVLRGMIETNTVGGTVTPGDFLSWSAAGDAALRLLLTGTYPVATWMPFLLAGLAIGRLDLQAAAVQVRLAVAGVVAAVLGYGGSWLALDVLGGRAALMAAFAPIAQEAGMSPEQVGALIDHAGLGTAGTVSPAFLLVDSPHTGTTFEIVGSGGVAVLVLAACLVVARWGRAGALVVSPLAAAGAMAATLYVAHIAALALVTVAAPAWLAQPWPVTALFVVAAVALALVWRRTIGRGPVEWILHTLSTRAGRAR